MRRLQRLWRHPHLHTTMFELLPAPGLAQEGNTRLHGVGAVVDRRAEHRELGRHVARPEHEVDATAARQVEDRDVLGDVEHVVQRQDDGGEREPDPLRAPRDHPASTTGDGR